MTVFLVVDLSIIGKFFFAIFLLDSNTYQSLNYNKKKYDTIYPLLDNIVYEYKLINSISPLVNSLTNDGYCT